MLRDITLGQFYPASSLLHKMDPRTKLVGTMVFLISVFVFQTIPGYAVATLFLAAMIKISKVPVKFMFRGLKAIFMILLFTVAFNILLTPGEVLWSWGILKITKDFSRHFSWWRRLQLLLHQRCYCRYLYGKRSYR